MIKYILMFPDGSTEPAELSGDQQELHALIAERGLSGIMTQIQYESRFMIFDQVTQTWKHYYELQ